MIRVSTILLSIFILLSIGCEDPKTEEKTGIQFEVDGQTTEMLYFSSTIIGESKDRVLTIKNTGTAKLKVESIVFGDGSDLEEFDFSSIESQLPLSIPVGGSDEFALTFAPNKVGSHFAKIIMTGNFGKKELKLVGFDNYPEVSSSPQIVVFESATGTQYRDFKIENIGNAVLTLMETERNPNPVFLGSGTDTNVFKIVESTIPAPNTQICPKEAKDETCGGIPKFITVTVEYTPVNTNGDQGSAVITSDSNSNPNYFVQINGNMRACSLVIAPLSNDTLDFGTRFIGSENGFPKAVSITNKGSENCLVQDIKLSESTDGAVYWLKGVDSDELPTLPATLERFQSLSFLVYFKPTAVQAYGGTLIIEGDDPMWVSNQSKKEISLVGTGVEYTTPIAVCGQTYYEVEPAIDNPNNPVSVIQVDGSESYDPGGSRLTYKWEKISAPQGSAAQPISPSSAITKYFVDLAGEHTLKLTVTNEYGLQDSCEVTAMGITGNALHVELFWSVAGDVDLHFKKPGVGEDGWGTTSDCYWSNCVGGLNWFGNGSAANPQLDRDDIPGTGPENMNISQPFGQNGQTYTVGVKNFSNSRTPTATVRIYCNGGLQFEDSRSLPRTKDFWHVASIEWTTQNKCNITPIGTVANNSGSW
ncbi:choice-of-anchor D domain-containing protein [bacterium]|nr:choice-of-anchor D domain-containing protein [bacterium]